MKVVIAEKPSVARDIANVLGASTKKEGYFEGNDYAVTYAFGHLVQIAEPEVMNSAWGKPWRLEQLPMIPAVWRYRIADKADAQFKIIKKLFSGASTIICATDAGREGEHIFRLIYMLSGSKKPVQRLWISSLTQEAIRDGFKRLKSSREFDNLADAAAARARADWIVGLNFTRAYTTINRQLCTVGRVQTPTLRLIVDRQIEIENFKPERFFEILVTFEPGFLARYITPGPQPLTRLLDKTQAQKVLADITPQSAGSVEKIETNEKKTKAPPLYDLLSLQKDANKRFGFTAQETLDLAQSLYEQYKIISYPRTEARHISTDMVQELPRILSTVLQSRTTPVVVRDAFAKEKIVPGAITTSLLRPRLGKAYVDDTKLTDHHAIIPTHTTPPSDLPAKQRNIYELVASRFLAIFLPPEVRDETEAILRISSHAFRARGVVIKDPGWTVVEAKQHKGKSEDDEKEKSDEKGEESQRLPPLAKGERVAKRKEELKEGKTTAPKPYNDASLLTAMKSAGKQLDDEDLADYMKESGLGTPATRAQIIERLLRSEYIERNKKALQPTAKGRALINNIHGSLKDVALTATWEQRLADMQEGKLQISTFEDEIATFVRRLLPEIRKQSLSIPLSVVNTQTTSDASHATGGIGQCPLCKQGVVSLSPKAAGCSRWREGCKFVIWRELYGKKLTDGQITELFQKRKTKLIKGFKRKDGSGTYDARLVLGDDFKVRLDFDKS
jgi:DNA topoisomerase-3